MRDRVGDSGSAAEETATANRKVRRRKAQGGKAR